MKLEQLNSTSVYIIGLLYANKDLVKKLIDFYNLDYSIDEIKTIISFWFKENLIISSFHPYEWDFVRGYFEYNGVINNLPYCSIQSSSVSFLKSIQEQCQVPCQLKDDILEFYSVNVIDFLGKLYPSLNNFDDEEFICKNNRLHFQKLISNTDSIPICQVIKLDEQAIVPYKSRFSDVGLDLTIIKRVKNYTSNTFLYDTGIAIHLPLGYYAEIVPRSSLSKSGYILANSIGIIDNSYRGSLYIPLTKVDPNMPDIELPFRCCQLIIRKQYWVDLRNVHIIETTTRGDGGFGSTG